MISAKYYWDSVGAVDLTQSSFSQRMGTEPTYSIKTSPEIYEEIMKIWAVSLW